MAFLYGAAVQGIQDFIYRTNSLKEIIGASDIVEQICTNLFVKALKKDTNQQYDINDDEHFIVHAAGNIKYIFENEEECAEVVKIFPKLVMEEAPGITISQAVVEMSGKTFSSASNELEKHLRIQRNKPARSTTIGLTGIKRNRQTGLPALCGKELYDEATTKKIEHSDATALCAKAFGNNVPNEKFPFNISDITSQNDWIAIIHADGNGLGALIQAIGGDEKALREFSRSLDTHTAEASRDAYEEIAKDYDFSDLKVLPIRPIILSGDDFTVICRADFALSYADSFIRHFEEKTKLTACAGIAYIKSSFPFYLGYELAEDLCSAAKKDAKSGSTVRIGDRDLPPSCIMFHRIQDSFYESYDDIENRELSPCPEISLRFGPYYISGQVAEEKQKWTTNDLWNHIHPNYDKDWSAAKNAIRRWLSDIHYDRNMAEQRLKRAIQLNERYGEEMANLTSLRNGACPAYDAMSLNAIMNQQTKVGNHGTN